MNKKFQAAGFCYKHTNAKARAAQENPRRHEESMQTAD